MDEFGIFNPRLVRQVKEEWERTRLEVRKVTAPILDEAERIIERTFRPAATRPTTPLDGYDWLKEVDDEEALQERLERAVADLAIVQRHTVTLDDPGSSAARFAIRVVLTDGSRWQAQLPVAALARATDAEVRLWALRLVGKVRQ